MLHQQPEPIHLRANLADPGWVSDPVEVGPGLRRLSVDVNPSAWGAAKLQVTYALSAGIDGVDGASMAVFRPFTPEAIELSASTPSLINRPLAGVRWIRLENTVSDSAADGEARAVVLLS